MIRALLFSSIVLIGSAVPAYAQFNDLINDTINEQSGNINDVLTDAIQNDLFASLNEEELESLTADALLEAAQQDEGAQTGGGSSAGAQGSSGRYQNFDGQSVLEDYKNTKAMLSRYSAIDTRISQAALPKSLSQLENIKKDNILLDEDEGLPFNIRKDALREAAISYGARGGLAWRSYEISLELERRSRYMERVFDFRRLLVAAPSGFMIEPPIISEAVNSMLIEVGGQEAAVSDRIYNIINNARIVSAPRTWRTYLERTWPVVEPPPDILRPQNDEEREVWVELVNRGWQEGVQQANDIFSEDLNRLVADFRGMVRYRLLLSQGMVSRPYALQVDRGVTGGGREMRVGDRAVQITGVPQLLSGATRWMPASR